MRKTLLFSFVLILLAVAFVACGDSKKPVVPTVTNAFAFLQEVPFQGYNLSAGIGQFVKTGSSIQFQTTIVKDPSSNDVVVAPFWSVYLSNNGDKVVFDLYGGTLDMPNEQWDIYVANADGSGLTQITSDFNEDADPQFSPDGTKVVFTSVREGENGNYPAIVTRNVTNPAVGEQILPMPLGAYDAWAPTFSPDGSRIVVRAYGWNEANGWFDGLVVMNADGSNPQLITNPYATCDCWDEHPAFTADGSQIVFTRDINTETQDTEDIYIMNADGTGAATQLASSVGYNLDPMVIRVSGVGDKILFVSNRDNLDAAYTTGYELYSMNLDGSALTRLTSNGVYDAFSQEWFWAQGQGTSRASARERHAQHVSPMHKAIPHPLHRLNW